MSRVVSKQCLIGDHDCCEGDASMCECFCHPVPDVDGVFPEEDEEPLTLEEAYDDIRFEIPKT